LTAAAHYVLDGSAPQVFCTTSYLEKKTCLEELYRAVVQRRPILTMLEPNRSQEGGLKQVDVEGLITYQHLQQVAVKGPNASPSPCSLTRTHVTSLGSV
jgi:hypothetical protein